MRASIRRPKLGLSAEEILVVVAVFHCRRAQMDNGMIPAEFLIKCRIHRGPELFRRARPIGEAIDGATVTPDDRRIVAVPRGLQLALV